VKTYHYALGHEGGSTMTVKELRGKLAEYPDEMPVFGTWEGVTGYIRPDCFSVETVHKGDIKEAEPTLLIDVEDYH
jgi:hypothetical protein